MSESGYKVEKPMIGIDLFSGAGGMSLGAKFAGLKVHIVVEADPYAADTYLHNLTPELGLFRGDIREFKKIKVDLKREPTVVFGGPPCQGFSTSNQKNRNKKNSVNWLFQEFICVTRKYMPDWVVFENVRGILETEGGMFASLVIKQLEALGYTIFTQLLHATDFGVPQKRARLFIIGSLHNVKFNFPNPTASKIVTVKQAISDLPSLTNGASECYMEYSKSACSRYSKQLRNGNRGCNNHLVTRNNQLILERYKHIPQGGNWENIPNQLMDNYADKSRCHSGIYRRLKEDEPSVVIGNYRKNMLIHPTEDRGLSVREAARLQSFPDWFEFKGTIGFQQQQVGNAVPPLLAKAVFTSILSQT